MAPAYKSGFTIKQQAHQLTGTHNKTYPHICRKDKYAMRCLQPNNIIYLSNCGNYYFSTLRVLSNTAILRQD